MLVRWILLDHRTRDLRALPSYPLLPNDNGAKPLCEASRYQAFESIFTRQIVQWRSLIFAGQNLPEVSQKRNLKLLNILEGFMFQVSH